MFYSFVLNMWMMGRLTEDQVNAYVDVYKRQPVAHPDEHFTHG